ncbi:Ribonuclease P protein component [Halanaerobium saccharolyticum subsp. saccharolyticum DSM 6643]|uniref:Ribonuclease P protein component n=1 Tax=Halanaerobium saccharolyticum subsp. saccharolyticum DSM 6643 TaxID=1293054 RepID=M5E1P5_9FIRM|nr:ribonuclease P protein component [Halanaerobium saccharolyticum]CCU79883.1 Ribonuclease P protein component [Halanaerobium saccharolyticum subsp. saccharolyticum DSM 6643]
MESLKKNKEFKKVYENGKSYATRNLVIYCLNYEKGKKNRYGLSVSKKIGNAVVRNKLKRRLREIIREFEKEKEFKGYDIIFIARKPVVQIGYQHLKRDVNKLYKKMNII